MRISKVGRILVACFVFFVLTLLLFFSFSNSNHQTLFGIKQMIVVMTAEKRSDDGRKKNRVLLNEGQRTIPM